eukprot:5329355-Pyramimonas_sp.AAC.1
MGSHAGGLSVSHEAVPRAATLQWAEIVPVMCGPRDGFDEDFKQRQQGRLALKLLTRSDCAALTPGPDAALDVGARLALLDLRVFVPEVTAKIFQK